MNDNLSIQWHWYGHNRHGLLEFDENYEVISVTPVSRKVAEKLIEHGMIHGS